MVLTNYFFKRTWQTAVMLTCVVSIVVWDGGALSKWSVDNAGYFNSHDENSKLLPGLKALDGVALSAAERKADSVDAASVDKHFIAKQFSYGSLPSATQDTHSANVHPSLAIQSQQKELTDLIDQHATSLGAEDVLQAWNGMTEAAKLYMLGMVPNGHPVAEFKGISSRFGFRTHPMTGLRQMHGGLDYRGERGDDILATADGLVEFSSKSEASGFGNLVTIMHANGFETRYGHLSRITVKVGDYVRKGQKIGEMGNTGRSTGVHLHYEVVFVERRLDPSPFGEWSLAHYDTVIKEIKGVPWHGLNQFVENRVVKMQTQLALRNPTLLAK
jgi:murein DD-endopeptidase MepM/ murein hydrolase activator NlpD